jgi:hypothetical protein
MEPKGTDCLSVEDASKLESHSCVHCQTALRVPSQLPQALSRIMFPQTISQAQAASLEGCSVFQKLFTNCSRRSVWQIFKTHWLREFIYCHDWIQAFLHAVKSLSNRPFQLVLVAENHSTRLGATLISRAYLDCADGKEGLRFNAYTYTGKYNVPCLLFRQMKRFNGLSYSNIC